MYAYIPEIIIVIFLFFAVALVGALVYGDGGREKRYCDYELSIAPTASDTFTVKKQCYRVYMPKEK